MRGDITPDIRQRLEQADTNPNASHSVELRSPGNGVWNWTLQISDVTVPAILDSTPNAHVAFMTWHFSLKGEGSMASKRAEDSPVCAYLMDINFPYNVSSQWDPDDSSCVSALGESCVSSLSATRVTENCDTSDAPLGMLDNENCEGMLRWRSRDH